MRTDSPPEATARKPYGSYVRPVLWALGVLAFLVFVVPTLVGFGILYRRDHAFRKAFPDSSAVGKP